MSSPTIKGEKNVKGGKRIHSELEFLILEREREYLLSKIPANPTVGFLQSKKESCSTWRGQRVGTSFLEFRQTP